MPHLKKESGKKLPNKFFGAGLWNSNEALLAQFIPQGGALLYVRKFCGAFAAVGR